MWSVHTWHSQITAHPRDTTQDIYDAKNAVDHLSGFNVCGRYLVVLYYQAARMEKRMDTDKKRQELEKLKEKFGVSGKEDESS